MGIVEMEEQEMNKMKHEQAEQAVRQVASSSGGTAQVFRATASQTDNKKPLTREPNMADASVGTDEPHTRIFDMTQDDSVQQLMDYIETESSKQLEIEFNKKRNMPEVTDGHLGQPALPPNIVAFFEQGGVFPGASSSSNQPMQVDPTKRPPETELEPKGKVGRPRKTQQIDAPPAPMLVDREPKRKTSGDEETPGKARAKSKRKAKNEKEQIRNYLQSLRMDALNAPEETQQQPASSSAAGSSKDMPKKQQQPASSSSGPASSSSGPAPVNSTKKPIIKTEPITKQKYHQLAPSIIGIQRLREAFEEAKNKNNLSTLDVSAYMK